MSGISFSPRGPIVSGVGGGGAWIDNRQHAAPPAGIACAWSEQSLIYQSAIGTIRGALVDGSNDIELAPRPASFIAADTRSALWASYLADGFTGVMASTGQHWPAAGLLAVHDGTIFLKTSYDGGGLSAWAGDTLVWEVPSAQPLPMPLPQFSALDRWRCCWTENGQLHAYGLTNPAQTEPCYDPCLVELNGEIWICYHGGPVVLRRWADASVGYILEPNGGYYTCAKAVDNSHIQVGYSWGPAAAGDVVTVTVDLTAPMVPLTPTVKPLPPVHIAPFDHPQWVGPFFATGQYGNVDHPGNCEILIRTGYDEMARSRPVFADLQSARTVPNGQLLGVYTSAVEGGATDANIQEAMAYAGERGVPVLVYSDTDMYPVWIVQQYLNEPNRIPVVRAYPAEKQKGEALKATPDEDVARIREVVAELCAIFPRVAVAHTYYTQSDNYPLSHILAMQEGLADIEGDFRLFASLGFSRLRTGGGDMSQYPELLDAFTQECAAPAGTPSPILLAGETPPIEPVEPPSVIPPEPPIEPGPEPPEPPIIGPIVPPEPPIPIPPEPIPPQPLPVPPEEPDMPIQVGQRGMFRPYGSKSAWVKAVVVPSQDEHLYDDKPIIYSISTNYPSGEGQICAWLDKGKYEDTRTVAGGGERSSFDGKNLLIARPDDFADLFEWVNLA